MHFSNKCVIKRIKKTRGNEYQVNGKRFKAFGSEVPPQVLKELKLEQVNFQQQLEGPYWFQLPASQVAKQLNDIVNLSIIDKVLHNANKRVRDSESEKKVLKNQVLELKKDIKSSKWIEPCRKEWKQLREMKRDRIALLAECGQLSALLKEIEGNQTKWLESCLIAFSPVRNAHHSLAKKKEEINSLRLLIEEYEESSPVQLKSLLSDFQSLHEIRQKSDTFAENRRTLSMEIDNFEENSKEVENLCNRLIEYKEALKKLSKRRCKTCGQPIPKNENQSHSVSQTCTSPSISHEVVQIRIGKRSKKTTSPK
jgi:DNA repair exonuclease SbcCD ATPase subunit